MNSIISAVYSTLETMTVSYTDKNGATATPAVYGLDDFPNTMPTAELPARVLLPLGYGGGANSGRVLMGAGIVMTWSVSDLFLLAPKALDRGTKVQAPVLMRYAAAYAKAIAQVYRFLSQPNISSATISAAINPGEFPFPAGSDQIYYGVKVDLTIEEIF